MELGAHGSTYVQDGKEENCKHKATEPSAGEVEEHLCGAKVTLQAFLGVLVFGRK